MKTKLTPMFDKVIVKRDDSETVSSGGIHIPDVAKERPRKGRVLAVGQGKFSDDGTRRPMDVDEGDIVLFSSYAGNEVKIDGEDLLILSQEDVLAKLN